MSEETLQKRIDKAIIGERITGYCPHHYREPCEIRGLVYLKRREGNRESRTPFLRVEYNCGRMGYEVLNESTLSEFLQNTQSQPSCTKEDEALDVIPPCF